MSKWKWIAQDKDADIFFYDEEPLLMPFGFMSGGKDLKLVGKCKKNQIHEETLINLETEDYEINDGILTRIPRKTELDKLIANVKKIDKKAAKWMNKNRHNLDDTAMLDCCFDWDICDKYEWDYIYAKLEEMAEQQQQAKETLKYRVGAFKEIDKKYLVFAPDDSHAVLIERNPKFQGWLTEWIEVEV